MNTIPCAPPKVAIGSHYSPGHKLHRNSDTGEFWTVNDPDPPGDACEVQAALLRFPIRATKVEAPLS